MRIATWNINGVKARQGLLLKWLEEESPDIACLQEIKSVDEAFPRLEIEAMGYNVETFGQKSWNGVAILSKRRFDEVTRGLPGDDGDEQSRLIEGVFSVEGGVVRVCCIYLPNGNPVGTDKFTYKLGWMDRLLTFVEGRLALEEPFILLGDYNIIPAAIDAKTPENWVGDALFRPESAERWRALLNLGMTDALRAVTDEPSYTFWDFKTFGWDRGDGIRIDHLLLSPQAADRLEDVLVHKEQRGKEKPSDHVPVVGEFAF
ncbi:MAG: exodeoxyribonuclease III [Devosia sp.]|uniref:exodeoxyribonuclease III n=1 Tax=Devosia sp. TaxID=1871048 RepID=UPI001AD2AE70|nr:exodeoxyribonuclease III [Devosia sp.]MBN9311335.1 exodeoxyribonuclease III [Devosia sp.]MBN9314638.1 exodeoxyribonuclease III [Devosia sp.]